MTDEILKEREIEYHIRSWRLIPSSRGTFEFTINGELVFSKLSLKRHAEPGEIKALLVERIGQL